MAFVPKYILILFALIGIDYVMAHAIERSRGKSRHLYLVISIVSNVGILFVFKYFNFFNENISLLAHMLGWNYSIEALRLLLPLGLSFHTFQSLSYVVEVYRGKFKAERHLGVYALYVMFFPQLVAGPIERPQHLLTQLKNLAIPYSSRNVYEGVRLLTWGFFKKLVIADQVGQSVDFVWNNYAHLPGPSIAYAMVLFSFQLYADFSGYSDIARGSAKALGIDVVRNFEQPYFSGSIAEFWRRWHISLSSWFRDYFFTPLVYQWRRLPFGLYAAIICTFLVTGLWHGAAWTFVIMGFLYGLYIVVGLMTRSLRARFVEVVGLAHTPKLHKLLQIIFTFSLVTFSWVFFRAPTLTDATAFLSRLFTGWNMPMSQYADAYFQHPFLWVGYSRSAFFISALSIAGMLTVEYIQRTKPFGVLFDRQSVFAQSLAYSVLVLAIFLFGVISTVPFIYFQF